MKIDKKSIYATLQLAKNITARNKIIKGKPPTLLHDIGQVVSASIPKVSLVIEESRQSEDELVTQIEYILSESNSMDFGKILKNVTKEVITEKLRKDIAFIKNVVKPILEDTIEKVSEKYNSLVEGKNTNIVRMELLDIPEIMKYPNVLDFYKQHTYRPTNETIKTRLTLNSISIDVIRKALNGLTSSELYPYDELHTYLSEVPADTLRNISDTYFTSITPDGYNWKELRKEISVGNSEKVLLINLLAKAYLLNPPNAFTGDSATYNKTMKQIIRYTDSILGVIIRIYLGRVKQGILLASVRDNTGYVYNAVLEDYLKDEHPIDAVYGAIVSSSSTDRRYSTIESIIKNKDELVNIWKRYYLMASNQNKAVSKNALKRIMEDVMVSDIRIADDIELALRETYTNGDFVKEALPRLRKALDNISVDEISLELDEIIMEVLMEYRFPYTKAKQFFEYMEEFAEHYPTMEPEDAAALASMKYVVGYCLEHIELV